MQQLIEYCQDLGFTFNLVFLPKGKSYITLSKENWRYRISLSKNRSLDSQAEKVLTILKHKERQGNVFIQAR